MHRVVYADGEKRRPVLLVPLDHPGPDDLWHYAVPAIYLPMRGGLDDEEGNPIPFRSIAWEQESGMVLLLGPPVPGPDAPVRLATRDPRTVAADEPLAAVAGGTRRRLATRISLPGFPLQFAGDPGPGTVVLDADGHGIAYLTAAGGLPLHAVSPWQDRWDGEPLTALQDQMRAQDPGAVLADIRKVLASRDLSVTQIQEALTALQRVQPLARTEPLRASIDRAIRIAHRQWVRLLSRESGVQALQQARASLRELGDDPEILSDATELALEHSTPGDAMSFFETLVRSAPDHAGKIRDRVVRRLRTKAGAYLSDQRNQIAAELLDAALQSFPQRAELRILYAQALQRLGQTRRAAAEATEAARLDPSFAKAAQNFQIQPGDGVRVRIPMPRDASTVPTTGSAVGHQIGFVIDTGASYTTVPSAVARALGLLSPKNPRVRLTTASGVITTEQVVLPSLTVAGRLTVKNVTAVVHDLPGNLTGKGLLGLNVLRLLNMRIDSKNGYLELSQGGR